MYIINECFRVLSSKVLEINNLYNISVRYSRIETGFSGGAGKCILKYAFVEGFQILNAFIVRTHNTSRIFWQRYSSTPAD